MVLENGLADEEEIFQLQKWKNRNAIENQIIFEREVAQAEEWDLGDDDSRKLACVATVHARRIQKQP